MAAPEGPRRTASSGLRGRGRRPSWTARSDPRTRRREHRGTARPTVRTDRPSRGGRRAADRHSRRRRAHRAHALMIRVARTGTLADPPGHPARGPAHRNLECDSRGAGAADTSSTTGRRTARRPGAACRSAATAPRTGPTTDDTAHGCPATPSRNDSSDWPRSTTTVDQPSDVAAVRRSSRAAAHGAQSPLPSSRSPSVHCAKPCLNARTLSSPARCAVGPGMPRATSRGCRRRPRDRRS